jgi:hypothetical protein
MLQTAPRRRLKSFKEVTKHVGVKHQVRRLAESLDFVEAQNPKVDLNYFTLSIPRHLWDEEKMEAVSELVDTVQAIEDSDVILLGMWISPTE